MPAFLEARLSKRSISLVPNCSSATLHAVAKTLDEAAIEK
jgi:hypothetical protein